MADEGEGSQQSCRLELLRQWTAKGRRRPHLTLLARCGAIMSAEVLANALVWTIAGIVFRHGAHAQDGHGNKVLGLALIAWTTGLRHGLDADHISAIDNATRRIVSVPQQMTYSDGRTVLRRRRPVTVGLFFSLGHSTVVFATIIAIAVSVSIADKLDVYGNIGGIIGASVSGSFLFLIGCINSVILYKTWRRLQASKRRSEDQDNANYETPAAKGPHHFNGVMTRIAMPLLRSVDRPWKMYPVGLLFGLGFDTASSIALLSISVIGLQTGSATSTASGNANVVLLALLFTAGMTLVDSADSCLMIFAYAPETKGRQGQRRFALIERKDEADETEIASQDEEEDKSAPIDSKHSHEEQDAVEKAEACPASPGVEADVSKHSLTRGKVMPELDISASRMSMVLTLLSILVAFAISLVVIMGLIGDQCTRCSAAADRQEEDGNGGLEGRWWLAWRRANDNSGYIGAGVVGAFAGCVLAFYAIRKIRALRRKHEEMALQAGDGAQHGETDGTATPLNGGHEVSEVSEDDKRVTEIA